MSKVYVVTNVEHGWDCVMEVFSSEAAAIEYVKWWADYTSSPKDILIIHSPHKVYKEFKKENFE